MRPSSFNQWAIIAWNGFLRFCILGSSSRCRARASIASIVRYALADIVGA